MSHGAGAHVTVRDQDVDPGTVVARVLEEHDAIRTLLDDLERASSLAKHDRRDGLAQLNEAVWRVYIAFLDHLLFEERHLAPLFRRAGEDPARKMILEHNEERGILLSLVEDSESDALDAAALAAQAEQLVVRFRSDMIHEEGVLARLVQKRP
jgi:hypothetical protein